MSLKDTGGIGTLLFFKPTHQLAGSVVDPVEPGNFTPPRSMAQSRPLRPEKVQNG